MPRKYELEVVRPDGTVTVVPESNHDSQRVQEAKWDSHARSNDSERARSGQIWPNGNQSVGTDEKKRQIRSHYARKKPPRVRMVVVELDGTRSPVEPFNRDTQKLREEEAKNFGPLHPLNV